MNIVNHKFLFPLSRGCQLSHTNNTTNIVEAIEELTLKLLPTINGLELKVGVLVESISFQKVHKLFDYKVIISANIIASFHKVDNMLVGVFFVIKLL